MADYTWVSYSGTARIALAVGLFAAAAVVAYAGLRLPLPVRPREHGKATVRIVVRVWILAIVVFLVCVSICIAQARHHPHLPGSAPADPITPITYASVGILFLLVLLIGRSQTWPVRIAGAAIAAMTAPMIFELPFDLIIMSRSYPAIPPDPTAYRVLLFAPLLLVELTTLAFLALSPMVTFRKTGLFCFASMLAVPRRWGPPETGHQPGARLTRFARR